MAPLTDSKDAATADPSDQTLSRWTLEPLSDDASGTSIVRNDRPDVRHEYSFASSLVRGLPHPPFISERVWEAQRERLAFRDTDVFVSTFAKCGTTLTEQVVLLLLNGGRAEELDPLHKNTLDPGSGKVGKVWTEMAVVDGLFGDGDRVEDATSKACMGEGRARMSVDDFDALPAPRVLKTHAPTQLFLDRSKKAKVIYVTRNPFDACVSCYYHPKPGVSPQSNGVPFDAFCKLWLTDRVEFGGWIDHIKGWREEYLRRAACGGKDGDMLWMSYEELVREPISSIQTIANFLGVDTASDPTLVERVASGCKFENVKKAARAKLDVGEQGDISHLRKGKTGDWRSHFSDHLVQQFEAEVRAKFMNSEKLGLVYEIGDGRLWKLQEDDGRTGPDK